MEKIRVTSPLSRWRHCAADPAIWQTIIDDFRHTVTTKTLGEGYLEAINACSEILAREFPRQADDRDELPNTLIINPQS